MDNILSEPPDDDVNLFWRQGVLISGDLPN